MKKLLIMFWLLLLLTSCWIIPTQEEIDTIKKRCEINWQDFRLNKNNIPYCAYTKTGEEKVMVCIKEYTNWLDEKYNNPDTVSNLREDNYSNVVRTCNEIFWDKK